MYLIYTKLNARLCVLKPIKLSPLWIVKSFQTPSANYLGPWFSKAHIWNEMGFCRLLMLRNNLVPIPLWSYYKSLMFLNDLQPLINLTNLIFPGLTLAVSLIWFFPLMYYAEAPSYPSYWPYYGPEEIIVGYEDIQLWYSFGPALCYCFGAFLFMNIAAATGVATYQLTATKASHHRLIRREREAVRKANRQWLVTRL